MSRRPLPESVLTAAIVAVLALAFLFVGAVGYNVGWWVGRTDALQAVPATPSAEPVIRFVP